MVKYFYLTPIDGTLTGSNTLREPGSNGNEKVLYNPMSSRTLASLSDSLVSYPKHLLLTDWAKCSNRCLFTKTSYT